MCNADSVWGASAKSGRGVLACGAAGGDIAEVLRLDLAEPGLYNRLFQPVVFTLLRKCGTGRRTSGASGRRSWRFNPLFRKPFESMLYGEHARRDVLI